MERMPAMLVLSRRPTEKVLFPGFGAAVQVLSIKAGMVRLGIEAPKEITVLRDELQDHAAKNETSSLLTAPMDSQLRTLRHLVRNRLNVTAIGLALMREQLKVGQITEVEGTLTKIEQDMQLLEQRLQSEKKSATPSNPPRKMLKTLLVEDDQNERELLAGFLRMSGFAVDTAGDGCDALEHLRTRERPDVVLLDMGLPRFDGAATAREIRRDPANAGLRILAVTGHTPDEYDLDQGPRGIDRWFRKPLDPIALVRELNGELQAI
jgi:carbon storage regulator CsrA